MQSQRRLLVLCLIGFFVVLLASSSHSQTVNDSPVCSGTNPIQHLIVLMLENRSFDHFLGFLKKVRPEINGLTGQEFNYVNPSSPSDATKIFVDDLAQNVDPDFDHSVPGTTQEIQWGANSNDNVTTSAMNGFVAQNSVHVGAANGQLAVSMFNYTTLPVLSSLALNFGLIDGWYADLPGPTMPNRFYFMSGTSHGLAQNNWDYITLGMPQPSIFDRLDEWQVSWRVYAETVPTVLGLRKIRTLENLEKIRDLKEFEADIKNLELPTFSWLEPSYFDIPEEDMVPRDQHPSHPVNYGEELIKMVYDTLRQSPYWNCSALLVTYDEHGGFADFQPTQLSGVPNPDGRNSRDPVFNFERLGIRVPAVLVSPWIDPVVVHGPSDAQKPFPGSQFSHSSLAATLQKIFAPDGPQLTNRTAWAAPFDFIWQQRTTPRTDAPMSAPQPYETNFYRSKPRHYSAKLPINGLQFELVMMARQVCIDHADRCGVVLPSPDAIAKMTENEAGLLQSKIMKALTTVGKRV